MHCSNLAQNLRDALNQIQSFVMFLFFSFLFHTWSRHPSAKQSSLNLAPWVVFFFHRQQQQCAGWSGLFLIFHSFCATWKMNHTQSREILYTTTTFSYMTRAPLRSSCKPSSKTNTRKRILTEPNLKFKQSVPDGRQTTFSLSAILFLNNIIKNCKVET